MVCVTSVGFLPDLKGRGIRLVPPVKFPGDEFDRASLDNAIDAYIGGETVPIGPLELQIAYKLSLGGRADLEDAAHLYTVFGETLSTTRLEEWVDRLDIKDRYERLTDI